MIGARLKRFIKETGLKQIDVCKATGLSPSRFSNYLSDVREPDFETLGAICDFLGIGMDDLRKADEYVEPVDEAINTLKHSSKDPVLVVYDDGSNRMLRIEVQSTHAIEMLQNMKESSV